MSSDRLYKSHRLLPMDNEGDVVLQLPVDTNGTRMIEPAPKHESAAAYASRIVHASVPDVIWFVDDDYRITYVTESIARYIGEPARRVVGRPLQQLLTTDSWAIVRDALARAAAASDPRVFSEVVDVAWHSADGQTRSTEVKLAVAFDDDRAAGFVGVARDLADRERLDEERRHLELHLQQSQRMEAVGRLAGGIAHDFNNMLSVILSYCSILREQLPSFGPVTEDIREINAAASRAAALTRQLLAFSRREVTEARVSDVSKIVVGLEKLLRRTLGEGVDLQIGYGIDLRAVELEVGHFEQVLVNLAVNARDAMPSGGTLAINIANERLEAATARLFGVDPGEYVRLEMADTGCGMPEHIASHAFEPFFSTKGPDIGTGLGLSMVYGTVMRAGGHIELETSEGHGTRVVLHLPATTRPVERPHDPFRSNRAALGRGETVLVVEDEPAVQHVVARLLERAGYRVLKAGDADGALSVFGNHRHGIDLVLTDVIMPRMSGPELARQLIDVEPELPILFMSGYADDETRGHGFRADPATLVYKPFTETELLHKVRGAIDGVALS